SLVLENTELEIKDELILAPDLELYLDGTSLIKDAKIDEGAEHRVANQTWHFTFQNQSLVLTCAEFTEVSFYVNHTAGNTNFAENNNQIKSQYIEQEGPPPRAGILA
ncbi:MAG: hypothetical protein ACPGTG_08595, partial [Flavobacteriales bacterium]